MAAVLRKEDIQEVEHEQLARTIQLLGRLRVSGSCKKSDALLFLGGVLVKGNQIVCECPCQQLVDRDEDTDICESGEITIEIAFFSSAPCTPRRSNKRHRQTYGSFFVHGRVITLDHEVAHHLTRLQGPLGRCQSMDQQLEIDPTSAGSSSGVMSFDLKLPVFAIIRSAMSMDIPIPESEQGVSVPPIFNLTTTRLCDVYRTVLILDEKQMIRIPLVYASLEMFARRHIPHHITKDNMNRIVCSLWDARDHEISGDNMCLCTDTSGACSCEAVFTEWQQKWKQVKSNMEQDRVLVQAVGADNFHTHADRRQLDSHSNVLRF
jgi:hypothetical protein